MKHLVIDRQAVRQNLQTVKAEARGLDIIADLGANAHGMGLLETARVLKEEGVMSYAVSDPRDAGRLRDAGFTQEHLMMLRSTADSEELAELIDLGVVCTVGSYDAAVAVNGIAEERKTVCEVQVKLDTGLGRYGFLATETDKIASIFRYMPNLAIVGFFSTYAETGRTRKSALQQYDTFRAVTDRLTEMGFELGYTHMADARALFQYDFGRLDAVRVGDALAGRVPGEAVPGLVRVGWLEAGVEEVGWFPKGHRVGRAVLRKPARLAVLSVGTYHGFGVERQDAGAPLWQRLFRRGQKPAVRIGGQRVPVVGPIGLEHTVVDVTDVACAVGDRAILEVDPVNVKGIPIQYIH